MRTYPIGIVATGAKPDPDAVYPNTLVNQNPRRTPRDETLTH